MSTLFTTLSILGATSVLLVLTTYLVTVWKLRARVPESCSRPGISVLKPLCGDEAGLYDNLTAIFRQTHPKFELILGCADPQDRALDTARRVLAENPHVKATLVVGEATDGHNPKVRLLRRLEREAYFDNILVSDSNVRPGQDYLERIQDVQIAQDADLVHCLLAGSTGVRLGERLEDVQLCGWIASSICFTDAFRHPCVIGKSMLMRRAALSLVGGFDGVRDILAEDYVLGERIHLAGGRVALSNYVLPVITHGRGVAGFFNRHVRWGQMRRRIAPGFFVAELLAQPLVFFVPLVLSQEPRWVVVSGCGLCVKWLAEAGMARHLAGSLSVRSLLLLPLKDLLVAMMWVVSLFRRTVRWRGKVMLVGPGSRLEGLGDALGSASCAEPSTEHPWWIPTAGSQ